MRITHTVLGIALSFSLIGCALTPSAPSAIEIAERPGEKALLAGIRAYEDAQYTDAERLLNQALQIGLASAKDRAAAHKHLAFIFCATRRTPACEAAFKAAKQADSTFALSKSEAGHPLWGPVYERLQP